MVSLEILLEAVIGSVVALIYGAKDHPKPIWRRALLRLLVLTGALVLILPIRAEMPVLLWLLWGFATLILTIGEWDRQAHRVTGSGRWW